MTDLTTKQIRNVVMGEGTVINNFVNMYECELGKKCMVGTFCEIQRDVKIGDNVRIQSHSFIPSGTEIGNNVFISHHFCGINDTFDNYKVNFEKEAWGKIIIEDDVIIGSSVTLFPVKVGKGSIIGAGALVREDVPPYSIVAGNPAKTIGFK